MSSFVRLAGAAAVLLSLLAGCSATAPKPDSPAQVPTAPSVNVPQIDAPVPEPQVSPEIVAPSRKAVVALLARAERDSNVGDYEAAVVSLERALRLAPKDPLLWQRLAEVRLQQGKFAQAEQLAAKSNALVGKDEAVRTANWRIIAQARELRGDSAGARAAYQHAGVE